ncbi:MAG TPA: AMP-binding protein [Mycobacteriales bacterium]|nr:AMP-binding protein [Mycobacteriales bacterium]
MPLIPDQLRWLAEHHPDAVPFAVVGGGPGAGSLSARRWHGDSSRLARGLIARGLAAGDRVALLINPEDGLAFPVAHTATHKAGGVVVPLNVRLTAPEVARLVEHCAPRSVIASPGLRHLVPDGPEVLDATDLANVFADDDSDIQVDRDTNDLAEILYTSGTTGSPKGVAIEHGNSSLLIYNEAAPTGGGFLHSSPMSTFAGLSFVYQPMRMGLRTLYLPKFDVATWLDIVEAERPPMVFLVPAMVELLLAFPDQERLHAADLSGVVSVSVGSAPIAPATLLRLQHLMPQASVTNSYSMTEAGTTYCILPKGALEKKPGSVGKPVPPAEIRIVDDEGTPVAAGTLGNVVIKPAGRPRKYYRDEEATAALYSGEWLESGDLGMIDEDGYLYITGRAKDVIIRGGHNVHASDVEAVLYEHPGVREAAVVGAPHAVLGEDVAAFIVLKEGATADADELIAFARERLADYKAPRQIHFRSELPRNATGKVLKRDLRTELASPAPS